MDQDDAMRARALARAAWPIRRVDLAEEGSEPVDPRSPGELVASVWAITLDAWASTGKPLPSYERADTPGRVIRRHG